MGELAVSVPPLFECCPLALFSPCWPCLFILLGNVLKHLLVLTLLVNCLPGHCSGKYHYFYSPLDSVTRKQRGLLFL